MNARYILPILLVPLIFYMAPSEAAEESGGVVYEGMEVVVRIADHYAVTSINATFFNPGEEPQEVSFSIKVPEDAYLTNLTLKIDNRTYYAKVVARDEAERTYQEAVEEGLTATQVKGTSDPRHFVVDLNLKGGERARVILRYEQVLWKVLGRYDYRLKLSDIEEYPQFRYAAATIHVRSSHDILSLEESPEGVPLQERWAGPGEVFLHYSTETPSSQDVIALTYTTSSPPINGSLYTYQDSTGGYFMHVFSPTVEELGGYMPKDIVFVLDRSGSMSGEKIEQLHDAFDEIVHQLHSEDRFNIVYFNNQINVYSEEIVPATRENKDDASSFIYSVGAGGSTDINEALLTALQMFSEREEAIPLIVFLTDGLPTTGVTSTTEIRENVRCYNEVQVSIYSIAFGGDADFEFLKALSLENYGFALRIEPGADASGELEDFYDRLSTPLLRDLTFRYSEGCYDVLPTYVRGLYMGSEVVVVGRYHTSMTEIAAAVTARDSQGVRYFNSTFPVPSEETNPFIARLWAHRKILHLLDRITVEGEKEELVSEVVSLAENFSFVTPYTSFILVATSEYEAPGEDSEEGGLLYNSGDGDGDYYDFLDEGPAPSCPPEDGREAKEALGSGGVSLSILISSIAAALAFVALLGYSRLKRESLLEQENRKRIYEYIVKNPGEHFRGIQRALDLEVGVLSHHLNILEREQLVVSEQQGERRVFYPAGMRADDKIRLSRIQEKILKSIQENPGATQASIAKNLGVSRKVVFYHLKFLRDAGLVEEERGGRRPQYYVR